jgi:hypothetical protein
MRYERKMKRWTGFESLGFNAYSDAKTARIASGSTHVCRRANILTRRSAERALRRLENRREPPSCCCYCGRRSQIT